MNLLGLASTSRSSPLSVEDVRSSLQHDGLSVLTEAADFLKGTCSNGIAKTILKAWEIRSAPFVAGGGREIRWQPQFDIFGMVSEEDRVDRIEEVGGTTHVELLSVSNGADVPREGLPASIE